MKYTKKELTFKEFEKIEYVLNKEEFSESEKVFNMLAIAFGGNKEDYEKMTVKQIEKLHPKLEKIMNPAIKFEPFFDWKGERFFIVPNFEKESAGAIIDMDNYFQNGEIIPLFNVLFRPLDGKVKNGMYNIEKYTGKQYFDDLPYRIVLSTLDFFAKS